MLNRCMPVSMPSHFPLPASNLVIVSVILVFGSDLLARLRSPSNYSPFHRCVLLVRHFLCLPLMPVRPASRLSLPTVTLFRHRSLHLCYELHLSIFSHLRSPPLFFSFSKPLPPGRTLTRFKYLEGASLLTRVASFTLQFHHFTALLDNTSFFSSTLLAAVFTHLFPPLYYPRFCTILFYSVLSCTYAFQHLGKVRCIFFISSSNSCCFCFFRASILQLYSTTPAYFS